MFLSGTTGASFLLECTGKLGRRTFLQPRIAPDPLARPWDYTEGGPVGRAQPWAADEVTASAAWWRDVAMSPEDINGGHIWFGGGVCFGRVTPMAGAAVAIDVVVLERPDAARPVITIDDFTSIEWPSAGLTYITVDTTAAEVAAAAAWWTRLATSCGGSTPQGSGGNLPAGQR
jgi:hypothetical protein